MDRFFNPSRKNWTKSRMSSALGLWKVNSSARTVLRVKVWLKALLVLHTRKDKRYQNIMLLRSLQMLITTTYFWEEIDVISGNESSSSTCSWSSTTYTPVQLTAIITSFFGRLGPINKTCKRGVQKGELWVYNNGAGGGEKRNELMCTWRAESLVKARKE